MNPQIFTFAGLTLLLVTGILFIVDSPKEQQVDLAEKFQSWQKQYNQKYKDDYELTYRFQTFTQNLKEIEQHNKQSKKSYTKGLNQFSDLTKEEFKQKYLMKTLPKYPELLPPSPETIQNNKQYPPKVDWRGSGVVTPIKDQQQCGSCWTFSTTGMLEGVNYLRNKQQLQFSEQQLVDCAQNGNEGCNGGWPYLAVEYVEQYGILQESEYPYTGQDGSCTVSAPTKGFYVKDYVSVPQNSDSLKQAASVQPVSICVDASSWFQYASGVFNDCSSDPSAVDHAVLLVGYDDSQWIVKNSWNTSWGDQGYIYLAPGNTCGLWNYAIVSTI